MISPAFAGVVLAAGASTRMGRDKALLPWGPTNFLGAAIEMLSPATEMVIVVGGANSETLKPDIYKRGAYLITNEAPERGQFSSMQLGLREVLNRGRDAAVVALVDRPPADAATMQALIKAFRKESKLGQWVIAPETIDPASGIARHGHPLFIGREMIEFMLKAPVTANAREILHEHQAKITYVPVQDVNTIRNINTPEEYAAM